MNPYERLSKERGVQHGEAFCRMQYECGRCGRVEWLWNSRDGVTPFCISSRCCHGATAQHVNWGQDQFVREHTPQPGERFFRDGTVEEARDITRRRIEQYPDYAPPPGPERDRYIDTIVTENFLPGWPMIETVGEPDKKEG